jgi:prophage maintenance system killer protein
METLLVLNGLEIGASVDETEGTILAVAAGTFSRAELVAWLGRSVRPITGMR